MRTHKMTIFLALLFVFGLLAVDSVVADIEKSRLAILLTEQEA